MCSTGLISSSSISLAAERRYSPTSFDDGDLGTAAFGGGAPAFAIPDSLRVLIGNAGNQSAVLQFREGTGPVRTCTYSGFAPVEHPVDPSEVAAGASYFFVGCDDGSTAGQTATGTWFHLHLDGGDSQHESGVTSVAVTLRPQAEYQNPLPWPAAYPDSSFVVPTEPVGTLEGSGEVSHTGEYTYTLPFVVPGGRGGVAPNLSLRYRSGGGDGYLGMGMSITGLPAITRCAKTRAVDGLDAPIQLTNADAFCMDGERLLPISGANGGDGTEYRTERGPFTRVVSYTSGGTEPAYFRAWEKSGKVLEYGLTGNSRLLTTRIQARGMAGTITDLGARTTVWRVSSVQDRSGNSATYSYSLAQSTAADGGAEQLPDEILYTNNSASSGRRRALKFIYEARPDTSFAWSVGTRQNSTKRLVALRAELRGPTSLLFEYRFSYRQSQLTARSELGSVARCASDSVCMRTKEFVWSSDSATPSSFPAVNLTPGELAHPSLLRPGKLFAGDVNGDGYDDIFYLVDNGDPDSHGSPRIRFGGPSGLGAAMPLATPVTTLDPDWVRAIDIDGDGRDEVLTMSLDGTGLPIRLLRWNGTGLVDSGIQLGNGMGSGTGAVRSSIDFGDLDGDGRIDVLQTAISSPGQTLSPIAAYWRRNVGGPTPLQAAGGTTTGTGVSGFAKRVGDPVGSGRASWILQLDGSIEVGMTIGLNPTTGLLEQRQGLADFELGVHHFAGLPDLNGDGLADFVEFSGQARFNTGNGYGDYLDLPNTGLWPSARVVWTSNAGMGEDGDRGTKVADFDGDGRDDVLEYEEAMGHRLFLNRGRGTSVVKSELPAGGGTNGGWFHYGWVNGQVADVNGDGLPEILIVSDGLNGSPAAGTIRVLQNTSTLPDLVTSVRNGQGASQSEEVQREYVDYSREWGPDQRTAVNGCSYPQRCLRKGLTVARTHRVWNGVSGASGMDEYRHSYHDPRVDVLGRGYLGFAQHDVFDVRRNETTTTMFDNATRVGTRYPYAGLPKTVVTTRSDGAGKQRVNELVYGYEVRTIGSSFAVLPTAVDEHVRDMNGATPTSLRDHFVRRQYDDYANITSDEAWTTAGMHRLRTTTYDVRTSTWLVGLPILVHEAEAPLGDALPLPREIGMDFDAAGRLSTRAIEPNEPALTVVENYTYNDLGLLVRVEATAPTALPRFATIEYDSDGIFPTVITNALGHRQWARYHAGLDVPLAEVDESGVKTAYAVDGFGRPRSISRLGEPVKTIHYEHPSDADTAIHVTDSAGGEELTKLDPLGRVVSRMARGFAGQFSLVAQRYNERGLVSRESRPNFNVESTLGDTFTYDYLDRLVSEVKADGATTTLAYEGRNVRATDPSGHQSLTVRDPEGRKSAFSETVAGTTRSTGYIYGAWGNLDQLTHSFHASTLFEYDKLGRRTLIQDPDSGVRFNGYNGFGDVTADYDASALQGIGQGTFYARDELGRVFRKEDASGFSYYVWDGGESGTGKPYASLSPDGILTRTRYDSAGRPSCRSVRVDGIDYATGYQYTEAGQVERVRYPVRGTTFETVSTYNAYGYLSKVADNAGATLFTLQSRNAYDQLTMVSGGYGGTVFHGFDPATGRQVSTTDNFGALSDSHGFGYNSRGLLTARTFFSGSTNGPNQTFDYDEAGRLTKWQVSGAGGRTEDYAYDGASNLATVKVNGVTTSSDTFGADGRPHAAEFRTQGSATLRYSYDPNGRQVAVDRMAGGAVAANLRSVTYRSFDLPASVTDAGGTTTFRYDARGRRVQKSGPAGVTTTVDDLFEVRVTAGVVDQVAHIPVENGHSAQIHFDQFGMRQGTEYLSGDSVGSTSVVRNQSGAIVSRTYFAPFGDRVDASGAPVASNPVPAVRKGFTGHDHDDELGLINMKGRIFDPKQRRFLTVDPAQQDEASAEGTNAYAYAFQSPLAFTDPSGFESDRVDYPAFPGGFAGANAASPAPAAASSTPAPAPFHHPTPTPTPVPTGDGGSRPAAAPVTGPTGGVSVGSADASGTKGVGVGGPPPAEPLPAPTNGGPGLAPPSWPSGSDGVSTTPPTPPPSSDGPSFIRFVRRAVGMVVFAGTVAVLAPVVAEEVLEYQVVKYGQRKLGFENHHGVLDAWAKRNIPGYVSRAYDNPAIRLSKAMHRAANEVMWDWFKEKTGAKSSYGIAWESVSPREVLDLTERMFDAAKVPQASRMEYYRAFTEYIYSGTK
jgi:RHS repeat-associated protein